MKKLIILLALISITHLRAITEWLPSLGFCGLGTYLCYKGTQTLGPRTITAYNGDIRTTSVPAGYTLKAYAGDISGQINSQQEFHSNWSETLGGIFLATAGIACFSLGILSLPGYQPLFKKQ